VEKPPKLLFRPTVGVFFECKGGHLILGIFPGIISDPHGFSTYPWDNSSGITNGTKEVPEMRFGEGKNKQVFISCPHCADCIDELTFKYPYTEVDIPELFSHVLKARRKKYSNLCI